MVKVFHFSNEHISVDLQAATATTNGSIKEIEDEKKSFMDFSPNGPVNVTEVMIDPDESELAKEYRTCH